MKVFFEFNSAAEASAVSAVNSVSAYTSGGSYIGAYATYSAFINGVLPIESTSAICRKFYFDFPVIDVSGNVSAGIFRYYADAGAGVTSDTNRYVGGWFDTANEIRSIEQFLNSNLIFTCLSGTQQVNTTINEMIFYNSSVDENGYSSERGDIALRFKLYDAYGQQSSVNPAERRLYYSLLPALKRSLISSLSGSRI